MRFRGLLWDSQNTALKVSCPLSRLHGTCLRKSEILVASWRAPMVSEQFGDSFVHQWQVRCNARFLTDLASIDKACNHQQCFLILLSRTGKHGTLRML